ncbi:leucine-rich repeat and fibronectin type-iii domain-containing protein 2-like [Plakobranchus ocellatus]|uniref:Leucine-rich repeat and fibronectin type-iii domain-containing protein 2-like n=1 Tax=Plakobranchus ocellatus TaxID=259542 RepID=A0AAV3Y963_9GAST|nr:leucine-rich repeat and fibronectin type-iii domain-containing protein 2-like [Plakobranchus ocellatus]
MALFSHTSGLINFILTFVLPLALSCPSECSCTGAAGEANALCSSLTIKTIPKNLSSSTKILTVTGTRNALLPLTRVSRSDFSNLREIIHLKISYTNLTYVAEDSFFDLIRLQRLELDHNRLTSILPNTLNGLESLISVSLAHNRGLHLHLRTFWNLPTLQTIYLMGLGLHEIDPLTFYGLSGLRTLDLSLNELTYFSPGIMSSMPNLWTLHLAFNNFGNLDPLLERFFRRLRRLQLGGNRWQCNCLLKWLKKYPSVLSPSEGSDAVVCAGPPSLEFRHLMEVDDSRLTCSAPHIVHCPDMISAQTGQNLTIKCLVTGDPYPSITWTLADGAHLAAGSYPGMPLEDRAVIYIHKVFPAHNGSVMLTAHNSFGTENTKILLFVNDITATTVTTSTTSKPTASLATKQLSPSQSVLPSIAAIPMTPGFISIVTQKGTRGGHNLTLSSRDKPPEGEVANEPSYPFPQPENNIPAIAAASAAGGAAVILAAVAAVKLCGRIAPTPLASGNKVAPVTSETMQEALPLRKSWAHDNITYDSTCNPV